MPMLIYATTLTGSKISQLGKVIDKVKVGDYLAIVPRPDNSYDNQAMSVHYGFGVTDPQVGWIPAKEIEDKATKGILFALTRHGFELRAQITSFDPVAKQISVNIELLAPEAEEPDED